MKTKVRVTPSSKRELRSLGGTLKKARLLRELTQQIVAERASITRQQVARIEKGDPSVSIGAYALVLQALGLLEGWGKIRDSLGEELAEEQLRKRAPKEGP